MAHNCAYDVPMARDMSQVTLGLDPNNALTRNLQHVAESRHFTLRSMPTQSFIDTFLPEGNDRSHYPSSMDAFAEIPAAANSPQQIYEPLVRIPPHCIHSSCLIEVAQIAALNEGRQHKARCPGFVFEDVAIRSGSVHPRRIGYMKPHVCCFACSSVEQVHACELSSRSELGHAELFFEVKPDPSHDFLTDAVPLFGSDNRMSQSFATNRAPTGVPTVMLELNKARGQHIAYVVEIFARQFREFFFSVSLAGSRARLLRWDRAGCIVSEAFDLREEPELLCEFLWRSAHVSPAGRGHDITVEPALAEEEAVFETLVTEAAALQLDVRGETLRKAVLQHYEPGKVTAVHVLDDIVADHKPTIRRLLVSRPVISPLSLCGRGTRGFWAVDASTRQVVFLKDTWRTPTQDMEGQTLRCMAEAGVRNIPRVVVHGDVPRYFPQDGQDVSGE